MGKYMLKVLRKVIAFLDTDIEVEAENQEEAIKKLQSSEFLNSLLHGCSDRDDIEVIDENYSLDYHEETIDSTDIIQVHPFACVIYDDGESSDVVDLIPKCPKCGLGLVKSENEGYSWSCNPCDEDFVDMEVLWENLDLQ